MVRGPRNISTVEQEFQSTPTRRAGRAAARARARVRTPGRARARRARRCRRAPEEHGVAAARHARAARPGRAGGRARRLPRRPRDPAPRRARRGSSACARPPSGRWPCSPSTRGRRSTSRWPATAACSTSPRSTAATTSAPRQWIGRSVPYHCTANGKVLLAYRAAEPPAGPLEALTSRTVVDRRRCSTPSSPRVRGDGFATAAEELELGPQRDRRARLRQRRRASSPRSACPARRCGSRRAASPSCDRSSSSRQGRSPRRSAIVPRECTPHDARRDPLAPLRGDAGRQRAGRRRRGQPGSRIRAWGRRRCSSTR